MLSPAHRVTRIFNSLPVSYYWNKQNISYFKRKKKRGWSSGKPFLLDLIKRVVLWEPLGDWVGWGGSWGWSPHEWPFLAGALRVCRLCVGAEPARPRIFELWTRIVLVWLEGSMVISSLGLEVSCFRKRTFENWSTGTFLEEGCFPG